MKTFLITLAVVAVIAIGVFSYITLSGYQLFKDQLNSPNQNGQNQTTTAQTFSSKDDLIKVTNIYNNQKISSPIRIEGQARGNWYFEASFPIRIVNENNQVIGSGLAEAQGEWMTENYVPYLAVISFYPGTSTKGEIIFQKDNPSGLPENDNELRVPVNF